MKVKKALQIHKDNGWTFARWGRGDHPIWKKEGVANLVNVDGKESDDIDTGTLKKMRGASGAEELR